MSRRGWTTGVIKSIGIMRGKGERGDAREEQDRISTRELVAYHGMIEGVLSRGETSVLVVETKGI
jgi:hypothetical protein